MAFKLSYKWLINHSGGQAQLDGNTKTHRQASAIHLAKLFVRFLFLIFSRARLIKIHIVKACLNPAGV